MKVVSSNAEEEGESLFLQAGLHFFSLSNAAGDKKELLVRTQENSGKEELVLNKKYKSILDGNEEEWKLDSATLVKEEDWVLERATIITDYKCANITYDVLHVNIDACYDLYIKGSKVSQGVIRKDRTKIEWVSSKSRILLTLLLTEQLFLLDESSGSPIYEKFTQAFFPDLVNMWMKEKLRHLIKVLLIVPTTDGQFHVVELTKWKRAEPGLNEVGNKIKQECAAVKRIYEHLPKLSKIELDKVIETAACLGPTRYDPTTVNTTVLLFISGQPSSAAVSQTAIVVNLSDKKAEVSGGAKYYAVSEGGHSRQSSRTSIEDDQPTKKRFSLDTLAYIPINSQQISDIPIEIMWGRSFHEQLKRVQCAFPNEERRLNLVMIPSKEPPYHRVILDSARNEKLDDEELRIAGFYHFCEQLLQLIQVKSSMITSVEQLGIMISTCCASQYAWQELKRREEEIRNRQKMLNELPERTTTPKIIQDSIEGVMPLKKDSETALIAAMMQNTLIGVGLKNRRWHLTLYKNVFVGHDAVDWFLKFFEDVNDREEAIVLGQSLMDRGVISHVLKGHSFLDGYYYYQFTEDYKSGGKHVKESMVLEPMSLAKSLEHMKQSSRVPMVLCIKSPDELIELHYDAIQNPLLTFHMTLLWEKEADEQLIKLYEALKEKAKVCGFELAIQMLDLHFTEGDATLSDIYYLDMEPDEAYPPSERMTRTHSIFPQNHHFLYVDQSGNNWLLVSKKEDAKVINAERLRNALAE